MGDIHGAYRALRQCLDRSGFDHDSDQLIFLGDVADGWPETKECVDALLKIRNLIYIFGNHDFWTLEWMQTGYAEEIWLSQGGEATVKSYRNSVPKNHIDLLNHSLPYFLDNNKLFVHAGFDPLAPLEGQGLNTFLWDRNLARAVLDLHLKNHKGRLTDYDEVFLGHTPVPFGKPVNVGGVWLMDTGAGWSGVLSMMDLDTKEIFSSDPVPKLYPGITGRTRK